jgi:hypothetical protein
MVAEVATLNADARQQVVDAVVAILRARAGADRARHEGVEHHDRPDGGLALRRIDGWRENRRSPQPAHGGGGMTITRARNIAVKEAQHDARDRTPESDPLHNFRHTDPHHAALLELFCRDLLDSGWAAWVGSYPITPRGKVLINPKTAKVLGLTIPPSVLVRADEIIQ